jgi:hypothetical protein
MMDDNLAIDFRNPMLVRKAGMSALKKELGTVGAVYFLRQFSVGHGDYTAERDNLLQGITLDEIISSVREIDAQKSY